MSSPNSSVDPRPPPFHPSSLLNLPHIPCQPPGSLSSHACSHGATCAATPPRPSKRSCDDATPLSATKPNPLSATSPGQTSPCDMWHARAAAGADADTAADAGADADAGAAAVTAPPCNPCSSATRTVSSLSAPASNSPLTHPDHSSCLARVTTLEGSASGGGGARLRSGRFPPTLQPSSGIIYDWQVRRKRV